MFISCRMTSIGRKTLQLRETFEEREKIKKNENKSVMLSMIEIK